MKSLLEHFYDDFLKEHVSYYSLLNKLNLEMKKDPDINVRIQQIKDNRRVPCTFPQL